MVSKQALIDFAAIVAVLIREDDFLGFWIVFFFKSSWLNICFRVARSQRVRWRLLAHRAAVCRKLSHKARNSLQEASASWADWSCTSPQLLATDTHRTFPPPSCPAGLLQRAPAKFLPDPHTPKQLNDVWKLNDMLGKGMYSTTRQRLRQSLLWPIQPADPLNTISPCLLGKRQLKPHIALHTTLMSPKQLPNNTTGLPVPRESLLATVNLWQVHENRPTENTNRIWGLLRSQDTRHKQWAVFLREKQPYLYIFVL